MALDTTRRSKARLNDTITRLKNIIDLQHFYLPGELEQEIGHFVEYYNNHMYYESLDNLTPANVYFEKQERLSVRDRIKQETIRIRRAYNLGKGGMKKAVDTRPKYTSIF